MSNPTIFLSFAAGILSFLSPCILPLIPSYMSYIGGVTLAELRRDDGPKTGIFLRTILFVIGFSLVFIALGVLFSGTGLLFSRAAATINLVAGLIVILLGINMVFDFWKFLNIERRVHFQGRPTGYLGSIVIGMAFGAGWTPCVGPILAGILFLAGSQGSVGTGILYLAAFSLGLGAPFLAASLFFRQVSNQLARIKRYFGAIRVVSGLLLVGVGVLIAVGRLRDFNNAVVSLGVAINDWHSASPAVANTILAAVTLLVGILFILPAVIRALQSRSVSEAGAKKTRVVTPVGAGFFTIFAAAAVLQLLGIIDIAAFLYNWLTFQGI